jgi:hypothetical protein
VGSSDGAHLVTPPSPSRRTSRSPGRPSASAGRQASRSPSQARAPSGGRPKATPGLKLGRRQRKKLTQQNREARLKADLDKVASPEPIRRPPTPPASRLGNAAGRAKAPGAVQPLTPLHWDTDAKNLLDEAAQYEAALPPTSLPATRDKRRPSRSPSKGRGKGKKGQDKGKGKGKKPQGAGTRKVAISPGKGAQKGGGKKPRKP